MIDRDLLTRTLSDLWRHQRYMEALTTAWQAPPVYGYHLIVPRGSEMTLRALVFRSCQQALSLARQGPALRTEAQRWVSTLLDQFPPPMLLDHGDGVEAEEYRAHILRAHLECVRVALDERPASTGTVASRTLAALADAVRLPVGFLRHLVHSLLAETENEKALTRASASVNIVALLVGRVRGVTATLTLELIDEGRGDLYPAPDLAFLRRDNAFRNAEETARMWSGLSAQACDVRWNLQRLDGQPITALTGLSLGVAFALGLAKLLATHKEVVDVELDTIGATAALEADGSLRKIGGLWKKLGEQTIDLATRGLLQAIVVADQQDDVPPAYVHEDAKPFRVLPAGNIVDAILQLCAQLSPRRSVCVYERQQCERLDMVGAAFAMDSHYQPVVLLREVTRERAARHRQDSAQTPPAVEADAGENGQEFEGMPWAMARHELQVMYEVVSLRQLLQNFAATVRNVQNTVPRFVVLGPPGSGKTTLLQYLARRATDQPQQLFCRSFIPARLRLQDWETWLKHAGGGEATLSAYLAQRYADVAPSPTAEQWRRWLQRGEVVLLLDGLDEVEGTPEFSAGLPSAFALFASCPTVITCRSVTYAKYRTLCPEFPMFTLAGLEDVQQAAYIRSVTAENAQSDTSPALVAQVLGSTRLRALTANPLLLGILCTIAQSTPSMPGLHTRGALYRKTLEGLLTRRPERVDVHYPGDKPDSADKLAILQQMAFALFVREDKGLTFSADDVRAALLSALGKAGYGQEAPALWVNALRTDFLFNSGILRGDALHGFVFLHLTFQEFLVAAAIAQVVNERGWDGQLVVEQLPVSARRLVDSKAWDPRWHEVIIFLAGQVHRPESLLAILLEKRQRDLYQSRLALALSCLSEVSTSSTRTDSGLLHDITTQAFLFWLQHAEQGRAAVVAHFLQGFGALVQETAVIDGIPLLPWCRQKLSAAPTPTRKAIIDALGISGPHLTKQENLLETLLSTLGDRQSIVRISVIEALGRLGKTAVRSPAVLPSLQRVATQDPDWFVRWRASRILESLTNPIQPGVAALPASPLVTQMASPQEVEHLQEHIVPAVDRAQGRPEELVQALTADDARTRAQAAYGLGQHPDTGCWTLEMLSVLIQAALHDRDSGVRLTAIDALGRLLTLRLGQVRIMIALAWSSRHDKDRTVRIRAVQVLGRLGKSIAYQREALTALLEALEDQEIDMRAEAAEAVETLFAQGVRFFRRWWGPPVVKDITELGKLRKE